MEALLLLVANAGQVIDKRRLMQTVWPDSVVEDNNLNQCILAIRKALGESAGSNRYVMTVPGRGFCFVCPVGTKIQELSDEAEAAGPGQQAAGDAPRVRPQRLPPRSFWIGLALGAAVVAIALLPFVLH